MLIRRKMMCWLTINFSGKNLPKFFFQRGPNHVRHGWIDHTKKKMSSFVMRQASIQIIFKIQKIVKSIIKELKFKCDCSLFGGAKFLSKFR